MKILRYRFIAFVYPHCAMEAEVTDGDKTYYVNIDINTKIEDECWWAFRCPLDKVRFDIGEEHDGVYDVDFSDVLPLMYERWDRDPVFSVGKDGIGAWMDWPAEKNGLPDSKVGKK